jgi:hypothetical protein
MKYVGITITGDQLKIARFSKVKNRLTLEGLEEVPIVSFVQEKNTHTVTGLSSHEVIRRDLHLKLKGNRALLKALPFQLEKLLPLENGVIYPFFTPQKEGTDIIVFATDEGALHRHLERFDSSQVSCDGRALYQWARLLFPHEKFVAFLHDRVAIAYEGEKIVFAQGFEEKNRVEAVFKNKFGHYFKIPDEGPEFQGFSYDQMKAFAIPIGLALEGVLKGCQFRQGPFTAPQVIRRKQFLTRLSIGTALGLAVVVGMLSSFTILQKKKALLQKIEAHHSASGSLEERVENWKRALLAQSKEFPFAADVPPVKDILGWLGGIQEPIEIVQFHYSLVEYPKAGEKREPYSVRIDLEFKTETPQIAQRFREALEREPTFIDKKQKITWNKQQESYKISFELRKIAL